MATTFNREEPMAGLPPNHVMESGGYAPVFKDMLEKEIALSLIKTTFEDKLKEYVELTRVSCPLFVTKRSGFNDNLVRFPPTTTRLSWLQTPSSSTIIRSARRWQVRSLVRFSLFPFLAERRRAPGDLRAQGLSGYQAGGPLLARQVEALGAPLLRPQARQGDRHRLSRAPVRRRRRLHPLPLYVMM
jgi:Aspartate-ammonia ligase